ncbi:hypothetical protein [Streptomyces sp. FH025]|uniref:hypothetical protein n=1 Tax=Streptomyces sp. FH025 TaxID=2815937 RepID=UPI001A9EABD7|nr:hypothetical protein [Streptomyces sp. FH025]MBO1420299.1 hypothetical protein [Streptomyces sp. FH025]
MPVFVRRLVPAAALALAALSVAPGGASAADGSISAVAASPGEHLGLTWAVLEQRGGSVHVGTDSLSNPYLGDTDPGTELPVLCIRVDGRPAPAGIPTTGFHSWAGGEVAATAPTAGSELTSRDEADGLCADTFGGDWRMAEFHDGEGWSFWATGALPTDTRFWTAIDDQPADPWS